MSVITEDECRELGLIRRHNGETREKCYIPPEMYCDFPEVVFGVLDGGENEVVLLTVCDRRNPDISFCIVKRNPTKEEVRVLVEMFESDPVNKR